MRSIVAGFLEGFLSYRMLTASFRRQIQENPKVITGLYDFVVGLVELFILEKFMTAFEQSLQDGYSDANRLKQKQFEYVMQRDTSQHVLHIDDNSGIAGLKMPGVTVFHYQPNCTANGEFLEDSPELHEWFSSFCEILSKQDERAA